jgi:plastocyanin
VKRLAVAALLVLVGCAGSLSPDTAKKTEPEKKEPVAYFHVDPSTAGVVSGKIAYKGPKPARKKLRIDEDPVCTKLNRNGLYDEAIVVNKNGTLANVFLYIKAGLEGKRFEVPKEPVVIDQKGCRFGPRVFGVQVGQIIKVTNSDPLTHNIHPMPKNNREWNQSQGEGDPPLERKFVRPEVMVRVKCNVHSWMRAHVGAVDHPYFTVTGEDGSFEIRNLPPGEYTLEAWHEKLGVQEQKLTVSPSGKSEAVFTFQGE